MTKRGTAGRDVGGALARCQDSCRWALHCWLVGILGLGGSAGAQTGETQQLVLETPDTGIFVAVAIDGDRVALRRMAGLENSIALWQRTRSGWVLDELIRPDWQGTSGGFATRMVLSDDRLVVGSVNHNNLTGVVHWMERGTEGWRSFFTPADRIDSPFGPVSLFGWAIEANEHWLAISARMAPGAGFPSTGAVVIYERVPSGWNRHALITPPPGSVVANGLLFGQALALDGNTLAISNYATANYDGIVHLYDFTAANGWTLTTTFEDPDPFEGDEFGFALALNKGTLVVGERRDWSLHNRVGAAHIIERAANGVWSYTREIQSSNGFVFGSTGDQFGQYVGTDGSTIVVAAQRAIGVNGAHGDGAVHVFHRRPNGTWGGTEDERLVASIAGERGLGIAMDYSEGTVIAAAYNWGFPSGFWPAYLFTPGVGMDVCDGSQGPNAARAHFDVMTDDPARPGVTLWGAPAGTRFVMMASASLQAGPGGSGGVTCLGGPVVRAAFGRFDAAGNPVLARLEISRIAALGAGQWTGPLYLQAWTRATTGETALSQAVRIVPR